MDSFHIRVMWIDVISILCGCKDLVIRRLASAQQHEYVAFLRIRIHVTSALCICGLLVLLLLLFGRLFDTVDLIKPSPMSVRPSVRAYVRPSVHKPFFDFNEILRVGRRRWVMLGGMQYDLIQGQGHEPFKVWNPAIFKKLSLLPFTMGAGNWPRILKLGHNI